MCLRLALLLHKKGFEVLVYHATTICQTYIITLTNDNCSILPKIAVLVDTIDASMARIEVLVVAVVMNLYAMVSVRSL